MTSLGEVLAGIQGLILDFDGPVCSVFANLKPEPIARQMIERAQTLKFDIPPNLLSESDPMAVLLWMGTTGDELGIRGVEDVLIAAERQAVKTAELSPGLTKVLQACASRRLAVAIASNNSEAAIHDFLMSHDLKIEIACGRPKYRPYLMKPNAHILSQALAMLATDVTSTPFVGDSESDIETARKVGARVIALANKPHKVESFLGLADATVYSMTDIAAALDLI